MLKLLRPLKPPLLQHLLPKKHLRLLLMPLQKKLRLRQLLKLPLRWLKKKHLKLLRRKLLKLLLKLSKKRQQKLLRRKLLKLLLKLSKKRQQKLLRRKLLRQTRPTRNKSPKCIRTTAFT